MRSGVWRIQTPRTCEHFSTGSSRSLSEWTASERDDGSYRGGVAQPPKRYGFSVKEPVSRKTSPSNRLYGNSEWAAPEISIKLQKWPHRGGK
jgi:hypothetical protein